jgi:hypothetical protein
LTNAFSMQLTSTRLPLKCFGLSLPGFALAELGLTDGFSVLVEFAGVTGYWPALGEFWAGFCAGSCALGLC